MIVVTNPLTGTNRGHMLGQDKKFNLLTQRYGEGNVRLIPEIACNASPTETVEVKAGKGKKHTYTQFKNGAYAFRSDGNEINTRANLRSMRMAKSFERVPQSEHALALAAATPTNRQLKILGDQAADFAAADEVYESEKSRIHSALAGLKVEDLDELAVHASHTWSASGLKVSEKRAELITAEVV